MKKELPLKLPEYTIEPIPLRPFEVRWEELIGWFLVPRLGEKLKWAMYDLPERARTECFEMEVIGEAIVHGIEGVEIISKESNTAPADHKNDDTTRTFIAQMTDTHVRLLAESDYDGKDGVRRCYTFLDGDAFLDNWGFGEDNCGKEIHLAPRGNIAREGNTLHSPQLRVMDAVGRYAVTLCGKRYDTICLIDLDTYNTGVCTEQFIDQAGRTVLWRHFNHNDWNKKNYGGRQWADILPENQRLIINGETYVHWYDCITEYVV